MNDEKTSTNVASIAAEIMEMKNPRVITDDFWKKIKSVAASALTQAPNHVNGVNSALAKRNLTLLRRGKIVFK